MLDDQARTKIREMYDEFMADEGLAALHDKLTAEPGATGVVDIRDIKQLGFAVFAKFGLAGLEELKTAVDEWPQRRRTKAIARWWWAMGRVLQLIDEGNPDMAMDSYMSDLFFSYDDPGAVTLLDPEKLVLAAIMQGRAAVEAAMAALNLPGH